MKDGYESIEVLLQKHSLTGLNDGFVNLKAYKNNATGKLCVTFAYKNTWSFDWDGGGGCYSTESMRLSATLQDAKGSRLLHLCPRTAYVPIEWKTKYKWWKWFFKTKTEKDLKSRYLDVAFLDTLNNTLCFDANIRDITFTAKVVIAPCYYGKVGISGCICSAPYGGDCECLCPQ